MDEIKKTKNSAIQYGKKIRFTEMVQNIEKQVPLCSALQLGHGIWAFIPIYLVNIYNPPYWNSLNIPFVLVRMLNHYWVNIGYEHGA